jgi:hypothetical protein
MTQRAPSGTAYDIVAEIDGIQYEIVDVGRTGVFGKPTFQACTFQRVMRPSWERRVIGTYETRAEALAKLKEVMPVNGENASETKEG